MSYSDLKGATEEKLNKLFAKKLEICNTEDIDDRLEFLNNNLTDLIKVFKNLTNKNATKVTESLPYLINYVGNLHKYSVTFSNSQLDNELIKIRDRVIELRTKFKKGKIKKAKEFKKVINESLKDLKNCEDMILDMDIVELKNNLEYIKVIPNTEIDVGKGGTNSVEASILFSLSEDTPDAIIAKMKGAFNLEKTLTNGLIKNAKFLVITPNSELPKTIKGRRVDLKEKVDAICTIISRRSKVSIIPVYEFSLKKDNYSAVWVIEDKYSLILNKFKNYVTTYKIFITQKEKENA
jgi:hypothetical protein